MPPSGEVNFPESSVAVVRTENCVEAHENVGAVEANDQRPVYETLASVCAIELLNRQQRRRGLRLRLLQSSSVRLRPTLIGRAPSHRNGHRDV